MMAMRILFVAEALSIALYRFVLVNQARLDRFG